ncbi:MAG: aminomethyl-transferring glycine dehydrogenase subunit GcvPA [Fimbriimonadaceae bacterium]
MPYVPHTPADEKAMLDVIGAPSIDHLFREIPENLRIKGELNIPAALDEHKLFGNLAELASRNVDLVKTKCFLGAGIYDRYVPASVGAVLSRGEFLTAYTPYQPELSQGYLQTIYEFQSMVSELFGVDLANASMYDGATAMAEAAIMAHGITGRTKLAVSRAVHPHYRQVMETYCWSVDLEVATIDTTNGLTTDFSSVDSETACVIVQYPNFFGTIEDLAAVRDAARSVGAMFIVVADPTACALLKPPGEFDADIVVGEGQPLGIAMGFGGPLLGLFGCKQEHVRRIPGRIVGKTTDHDGRPGYAMTLRTREQDIRREKATSNICTNEALMALAATVYMSALGKNGMQTVAKASVQNTQYAIKQFAQSGIPLRFPNQRVFGEFVLQLPVAPDGLCEQLLSDGYLAGLPLGHYYEELSDCLLVAVTETRTKQEIDEFVRKISKLTR